jgi:hypothetical protein
VSRPPGELFHEATDPVEIEKWFGTDAAKSIEWTKRNTVSK